MRNKPYIIAEILCVLALIVFVGWLCFTRSGGTTKSIEEISDPVFQAMEQDQMVKQTNADAYKAFGIDFSTTQGTVYYANNSVMDVSELLIIKLGDENDAQAIKTAIETRVADQQNLYKNYAPDQYALLQDCIIQTSGNTIFYCTAKNANELYEAFKKAL